MTTIPSGNGKRDILVNGPLIARAIAKQQLSVRQVARETGTTFNIIFRMTKENRLTAQQPILFVARLAELLDISIADIHDPTPLPTENRSSTVDFSDDADAERSPGELTLAQRLARLLIVKPGGTEPSILAQVLETTVDELETARREIDSNLAPLGVEARHANGTYYLTTSGNGSRRDANDDAAAAALLESQNQPMNQTTARILSSCLEGRFKNNYSSAEQPRIAEALNMGYLVPGDQGTSELVVSEAFRDAFPD